ncbi:MAG: inositol monophosphatase family protein [Gammaproteobacteria bacterium]|nr:inositol monophosphatase family protein [Gammaproteobacteria bacterium]
MHPMLTIGVRAARRAGDIISRSMDRLPEIKVETKANNDFVSEVDRKAEAAIIDTIRQSYRDHAFLAEESGKTGDSDHVWIIDPLDGTTNFLHGFPVFAVSLALQVKGRTEVGIIYDPMRQELFTAERGGGVTLDDKRIRVGKRKELNNSLIGTGFPFRDAENLDTYMPMLRAMLEQTRGVRRPGAAALDLAYVAAGRLDGFFEMGLQIWDIAAGALMVQEAGGLVGSLDGGTDHLETGNILAANPKLFAQMARVLKAAR